MSTGATNTCPSCGTLVVLGNPEVKNLLALPWVETAEDLATVIENVACDECCEWHDLDSPWKRPEDLLNTDEEQGAQKDSALDDLI